MRAKEFIAERQQLDEFAFAIPAVISAALETALGRALWTAFMTALEAYTIYEMVTAIVGKIQEKQYNIDKMDALDWLEVVVYAALAGWAGKGLLSQKDKIIAMIPTSTKETMGNYFKSKFEKQVKDEIAKKTATATPRPASTGPKDPNKIDRPFSKDAPTSTTPPTGGSGAFNQMAQDLTKKPKNPNLVDRPYSK
jgi:hypothetical protein